MPNENKEALKEAPFNWTVPIKQTDHFVGLHSQLNLIISKLFAFVKK